MNIVLLQTQLSLEDIEHLLQEFPHYLFLSFTEATYRHLSPENWAQVEIMYGSRLAPEELDKAQQLHWIHSPDKDLNKLCLPEIEKRGNIILTAVREENLAQIGEFVFGAILAFSKNMFHFYDTGKHPNILWDSKWREGMWTLQGRQFLQIGMEKAGGEIARRAQEMGMRVFGASDMKTFHPNCHKTFSYGQLHSILPSSDVICLNVPKTKNYENFFGKKEIDLAKEGSILILLGNPKSISEEHLVQAQESGKFRGILIDAMYQMPLPASSPLWKMKNTLITPDVSPRPKTHEGQSIAIFRYNLRQYLHGNFKDMRNVVNRKEALIPESQLQ